MFFDFLAPMQALLQNEIALSLALFGLTAALIACCIPGMIVPLSMSSGALLGGWQGILVVSAGGPPLGLITSDNLGELLLVERALRARARATA